MTKHFLVFLLSLLILENVCGFEYQESELESDESLLKLYNRWKSYHHVSLNDSNQRENRFGIFKENAKHILSTNKMRKPYKLKLNMFANLTAKEFVNMHTCIQEKAEMTVSSDDPFIYENNDPPPDSLDWRLKGAVTNVKNQGECGSCWAFSTVETIEGINHIRTNDLISLSAQELIDCSSESDGCKSGYRRLAFNFIKENGITTETNYPYKAINGKCDQSKAKGVRVTIDGYENVPRNNETALLKAVARQPVTVGVEASHDFMFYSKGVLTGKCGTTLNHAMTVVGYGSARPTGRKQRKKYWLVKNSHGPDWGEEGYIRIERGIADPKGRCGIAKSAVYPLKN